MKYLIPVFILFIWAFSFGEAIHCNLDEDKPVCGSDGVTYANPCRFGDHFGHNAPVPLPPATILYYGHCDTTKPTCGCPKYYAPVCGSDRATWINECLLNCAKSKPQGELQAMREGLKVDHHGYCHQPACDCTGGEDLVCGSDNLTYKNKCFLDCIKTTSYGTHVKLSKKKTGKC